jgi:hypothetical protein
MQSSFDIINPLKYSSWDALVLGNSNCTIFHTSAWAKVLHEAYGYEPVYLSLIENGTLSALLPVMEVRSILTGRRGVSLPFSDYSDPILAPGMPLKDAMHMVHLFGKQRGWKFFELRDANDLCADIEPSYCFYGHIVHLSPDEKSLFSSLRISTRRNIRKAIQENVKTEISQSLDAVKEYYRLHCMTRKWHGLPPQPFYFFNKIHEHIISRKMGFVILASHEGKNIAGAVYLHFGTAALYKYGASDRTYQHLRANNLVMWEAIKWYAQNSFKSFCFGRTEMHNSGLLQYKSGWGTRERIIKYYRYDLQKECFVHQAALQTGGNLSKLLSKMPIPCLTLIGALAYRHIG